MRKYKIDDTNVVGLPDMQQYAESDLSVSEKTICIWQNKLCE